MYILYRAQLFLYVHVWVYFEYVGYDSLSVDSRVIFWNEEFEW